MRGRLLIVIAVALGALPHAATTPTFTPAASMKVARAGHQATLLRDGRVLVTGGYDDAGSAIGAAEIFTPATGAWATTASIIAARTDHAVASLPDGRVLAVGGVSSIAACRTIATAEIYDTASGSWSPSVDPPTTFGAGAIAVALRDGRILVAGGRRCPETLDAAALFNPTTNAWSATASMKSPRAFHSAVLLADGRVLVAGGAASTSAEIYDPAAAAWTSIEGAGAARFASCGSYAQPFLALLPGGGVLAAGGVSGDCASRVAPAATVQVFDAKESRWSKASGFEVPRALAVPTVLPDGRVLVAGGFAGSGVLQSSAEFFDPAVGGWTLTGALQAARAGHTATRLVNGSVLIAGGITATGRTATTEIYLPEIGFSTNTTMPFRNGLSSPVTNRSRGWGIATSASNHVFIAHGPGGANIVEWDVQREPVLLTLVRGAIGAGLDEIHSLRIDSEDSIWVVVGATNSIVKLDAEGQTLLRFGRRDPATGLAIGLDRPTDLAVDRAGSVFVTDGGHARIVKFDAAGRFIRSAGSPGAGPGEMKMPHSVATDASGRVYVADGNARIQVFDNDLRRLAIYDSVGQPWALCITPGPHQYLYSASNPEQTDTTRGVGGEIYKLELDGTIVGRIGRNDNPLGTFRTLHSLDCREANELVAASIGNFMHVIRLAP